MKHTYLGIDMGTSAMKMVLIDSEKAVLRQVSEEYEAVHAGDGWSEIDPVIWYSAMKKGIHKIMEGQDTSALAGIGVTGQMHTLIVLCRGCLAGGPDQRRDGSVSYRAILQWLRQRLPDHGHPRRDGVRDRDCQCRTLPRRQRSAFVDPLHRLGGPDGRRRSDPAVSGAVPSGL